MKQFTAVIAVGLLALAFVTATPVAAQETKAFDLSGRWTGECDGCVVRKFTLDLMHVGEKISGTIQTEGSRDFGDTPKPIADAKVVGDNVKFRGKGDWGDPFDVELRVGVDGRTMKGIGYFKRTNFGLTFTRSGT